MTCGTKQRHPTRDEALLHVKALVWTNHCTGHDARSAGLSVYPCDECDSWHVGHQQTAPACYHYTIGAHLDAILTADALKVPAPRRAIIRGAVFTPAEPAPLLWLSRNPVWEFSVMKVVSPGQPARIGRAVTEALGGGLVRFAVPSSLATLRWSDYLRLNTIDSATRDRMARVGDPTEWLATDQDVPLSDVRSIEVFYRGAWINADHTPDDFDEYLVGRRRDYETAMEGIRRKQHTPGATYTVDEAILIEDDLMEQHFLGQRTLTDGDKKRVLSGK